MKEECKIPQIAGTDVLVIFKLILPDYLMGQGHTFTQNKACQNAKRNSLSEDILLSNVSVYKHMAHDDTVLQHMTYFPEKQGRS